MSSSETELSWLRLPATQDSLQRFRQFVLQEAGKTSLSQEKIGRVDLVLEEVVQNILSYAYSSASQGSIEIGCGATSDNIFFMKIQDQGRPFNPLMQRTPDLKGDIANRQEGGLGIFLTQQMSDRISYQWQDGKNVLEIGFDFV